jgi:hypothetical protein
MEKHVNIVAVPQLNGLAGIVLVNGQQPEPETAKKAEQEQAPIISTPLQRFDVVGILYGPVFEEGDRSEGGVCRSWM